MNTAFSGIEAYGFEVGLETPLEIIQLAVKIHEESGVRPLQGSLAGTGAPNRVLPYDDFAAVVESLDPGAITGFSLNSCPENVSPQTARVALDCSCDPMDDRSRLFVQTTRNEWPWFRQSLIKFCDILHPAYAFGYYSTTYSELKHDSKADYAWRSVARSRLYSGRFIRDVYNLNLLTKAFLGQSIDGATFQEWVLADPGRGTLTPIDQDYWLWEVETASIRSVRNELDAAHLLVRQSNPKVWEPYLEFHRKRWELLYGEEAQRKKKPLTDPKKCVALVRLLEDRWVRLEKGDRYALASLKEFFDGNDAPHSLGVNLGDHPGGQRFFEILKKIKRKRKVQDVLVAVSQVPIGTDQGIDDLDYDDWPISEDVFILTSADADEVRDWCVELRPDEISVLDKTPEGVPELKPGMHVVNLWWD